MRQLMDVANVFDKEERARIIAEVEQELIAKLDDYNESEVIQAAVLHWWAILFRQYSPANSTLAERAKRRAEAAAEAQAKAKSIKESLKVEAVKEFLDGMTPLGKPARDCDRNDCVKLGGMWVALGKKLNGTQKLGSAFASGKLTVKDIR